MTNSATEIQFRLHASKRAESGDTAEAPSSCRGRLPRVTQVLALAIHFQDMIRRGEACDYADLARLGCITRERMSQIMELIWLTPELQQEILEFPPNKTRRFPISEVAARRVAERLDWAEQREEWSKLKEINHLD
jgi:hypothetical protein